MLVFVRSHFSSLHWSSEKIYTKKYSSLARLPPLSMLRCVGIFEIFVYIFHIELNAEEILLLTKTSILVDRRYVSFYIVCFVLRFDQFFTRDSRNSPTLARGGNFRVRLRRHVFENCLSQCEDIFHSQFTFFRLSSSHLLLCFFVKTSSVVLFRSRFVARSLITLICLSERILSFFMRSFSIVFGLLHGWQKTYYSSARFSPKISPILIMCRRLSSSFVSLLSLFL